MDEVEIYYKRVYFDAIDTIVAINLTNRFNQPGFQACQNIEQLLLNAVNNKNYEEQQKNALAVYEHDLDIITLTTWLESLKVNFSSNSYDKHPSKDIIETLKTSSVNFREYFSQVIILLKILLVMTATNAVSERSVSNIRRIKDLLRTSMTQKRLNHCMILSVHKERTDNLDLSVVANDFCCGKEERTVEYFLSTKGFSFIERCKLKIYFGD